MSMTEPKARAGISRKTGIILAIVIVAGFLALGAVLDKALAYPGCNVETGGCPASVTAVVNNGVGGSAKFRDNQLGRNPGIGYGAPAREAISIKIMRVHNRQVTQGRGFFGHASRAKGGGTLWTQDQAWGAFQDGADTCVSAADVRASAGSPRGAIWTCEGAAAWTKFRDSHPPADWTPGGIEVIICGGVAGIGWKAALAGGALTGPGGPWVAGSIIAGGAACAFADDLANMIAGLERSPA